MAKRKEISKEELKYLYEKEKLSTFKIAKQLGFCQATIWKRLKEFKIKRRLPGIARVKISKQQLEDLYSNKKLSTWKIEKKLKIPRGTIHRKLKEFNIPTRDLATANIKYPRKDFSGDLLEKAYIIGFRIGDLGVRKIYPNSRTISVASGSTIQEQIDLIRELFNPYAKIWMKKAGNKINIQTGLNESFDFLLSKEAPSWVWNNKNHFFSFFAGFIDAEGHIGIYNNMAKFSLGNYDHKLLLKIHNQLKDYGIKCSKLSSDNRKGKTNNEGYKYNSNYWQFRIHTKSELSKLFDGISPYIKHKQKIKALNMAVENINLRTKSNNTKKMENKKNFQISTAIDYPSAKFHLGHAYEKVCTDIIARWKRLQGFNVHFSTGTDCHGLKIQRAAEKAGKTPEQFVNEISKGFKELCNVLNISYDDFIMTTEKRHEKTVIDIINKLKEKGDIYKGDYEGSYCVDCETYYTQRESIGGCCPVHKKKLETIKEESYFFKLSKYQKKLIENIKKDNLIWPAKKQKEILNRLKEPIRDLSISRKQVEWGIPLPFEKDLTIFVWIDALINYLTTIDYPNKKFKEFWPATHVVGSDIIWHHSAIWYSILSSLGIKLPKVVVHGFINLKGEKLSKARGITVDPIELANKYSTDSLRYFLMRHISFGEDGDFSEDTLIERHNNELANKLGNLVSRVSSLVEKYGIKRFDDQKFKKTHNVRRVSKIIGKLMDNFELDKALNEIFAFIDRLNEYAQARKPWENNDCENRLEINQGVLYNLVQSIREIAKLISPFIPETAEKISEIFKTDKIKKSPILFQKIKQD
jgi:methionyl-tRNA synthetase